MSSAGATRLREPGIYQANPAVFEVGGIAGGQYCSAGAGDGRDLRVQVGDWTALPAAGSCDRGKGAGGILVERKNAAGKIFRERRLGLGQHVVTALPPGKKFDSKEDFGHGDGGDKEMAVLRLSG